MRALIAGFMLILAPYAVLAGDARMLFMAASLQGIAPFASYDFEDTTLQGWSGGAFANSGTNPHGGSRCIVGTSGYTEQSVGPVSGTLSFWYRCDNDLLVKVDGSTVATLSSTSQVWTPHSVAISGTTVRFEIVSGIAAVDDIYIFE